MNTDVINDKVVLAVIGLVLSYLIHLVPQLAPYADLLTLGTFLVFGVLVFHQGIEDLIQAWLTYKQTTPPPQVYLIANVTDQAGKVQTVSVTPIVPTKVELIAPSDKG